MITGLRIHTHLRPRCPGIVGKVQLESDKIIDKRLTKSIKDQWLHMELFVELFFDIFPNLTDNPFPLIFIQKRVFLSVLTK